MALPMDVAVIAATRSAVGRGVKGTLRDTRPDDLAALLLSSVLKKVDGLKGADVDDVVLGCAMPEAEQGLNIARNAVLMAGYPDSVPAETINRFCSSGLQAVAHAAQSIQSGCCEVVVAGGVESMSMVPMSGNKPSLSPTAMQTRPEIYIGMGHTAERVAKRFGISRQAQDEFAAWSHQKAAAAERSGAFAGQITPVAARVLDGAEVKSILFERDECPRFDTTVEKLATLRPAFAAAGSVTAGNSSPLSDGAAALVLASDKKVAALGARPLLRMRDFKVVGVAPDIMGIGPLPAIRALLAAHPELDVNKILFEINEAFAAQAKYVMDELKIPKENLNVNGGAIAMGHPLGCTGAKLSVQLAYEMQRRRDLRWGIVSMCIGGGMGAAGLFSLPS